MGTTTPVFSFEVTTRDLAGLPDARGDSVKTMLASNYNLNVQSVRVILGYQVRAKLSSEEADRTVYDLFADPVMEQGSVNTRLLDDTTIFSEAPQIVIQAGFKPGVTDNAGQAGLDGLLTLFPQLDSDSAVATTRTYAFWGVPKNTSADWLASKLHNPMIERASIAGLTECKKSDWPSLDFPNQPALDQAAPAIVDLEVSDKELIEISETGLLALNLNEMKAIQSHYRDPLVREAREQLGLPPNAPTDAELECLAQTWSEHCSHKIFAAKIHHKDTETGEHSTIDSLFKTHIMKPTLDIQKEVDWLLSIFHDNSGVIAWNEEWSLCMKAETHNSPSALDPFGGAMTGIVGVNRDILGTGLGARPIANTDVFCFGPPEYSGNIPEGLFHPSRVMRGVHAGVRAGGNESGIPTVNGAIIFDDRYLGKPLVYCGTAVSYTHLTLPTKA